MMAAPPRRLSSSQLDLVDRMTRPGASARTVAGELGISEQTIKNQLAAAYREYDVRTLAQLVRMLLARQRR